MLKEPIHLQGVKIVDSKCMKQSKVMRYTIELTVNDSKQFCGVLGLFQPLDIVSDITITPTEREGEDNGHEVSVENYPGLR